MEQEFLKSILDEEAMAEYYNLKVQEKQNDDILIVISVLISELLKDMKRDNFLEKWILKMNNLIYKFNSIINNLVDDELENVTEMSLYINDIEKKCLNILRKILKNNLKNGINNNIADIYCCLICLDNIQTTVYKIQNDLLRKNQYYGRIHMYFPNECNYNQNKENADKIYEYVKKLSL